MARLGRGFPFRFVAPPAATVAAVAALAVPLAQPTLAQFWRPVSNSYWQQPTLRGASQPPAALTGLAPPDLTAFAVAGQVVYQQRLPITPTALAPLAPIQPGPDLATFWRPVWDGYWRVGPPPAPVFQPAPALNGINAGWAISCWPGLEVTPYRPRLTTVQPDQQLPPAAPIWYPLYVVAVSDIPWRVRPPTPIFQPPPALNGITVPPVWVYGLTPPSSAYSQRLPITAPDLSVLVPAPLPPLALYWPPYPDVVFRAQPVLRGAFQPPAALIPAGLPAYSLYQTPTPASLFAQRLGIVVDAGMVAGLAVLNPALYQLPVPWWLWIQRRPSAIQQPAAALIPPIPSAGHPAFLPPYWPTYQQRLALLAIAGPLYTLMHVVLVESAAAVYQLVDQSLSRYGLVESGAPASGLTDTSGPATVESDQSGPRYGLGDTSR